MNDLSAESKINELSTNGDSLFLAYKFGALAVILLFSLLNVGDTLAISHFRQIFEDALPGKILPFLTNFFLGFQTLVTCLAVLWPTLGILAAFVCKRISTTMIALTCLLILVLLQLALNWIALFMPMTDLLTGMSDVH